MERVSHQFGKSPLYLSLLFLLFPPLASKQQHSCARIPRTAFLRLVLSAPLDAQQEPLSSHTQCVLPSKSFPSGERLSSFCLFQMYRSTCPTRSLHAPLQVFREKKSIFLLPSDSVLRAVVHDETTQENTLSCGFQHKKCCKSELKKIKFGCCTALSQLIPYYLTLLWSSSLFFFFFVSPLQYSLHPKDTAKCFTSSTEKEKLFLAPIAVVSIEHPAYPAHKAQSLILLGCTNASAIKQAKGQPAHLTCYQLATKVSLLSHWACSCINGHHLVIYISCERWWSHGVSFDSVVSECCPSYAYRSVIQKALH